jgi:hypothetical protein
MKKVQRITKVVFPKDGADWGDMRTIARIFFSKETKRLEKKNRMTYRFHGAKLDRFLSVRVQIPNS